MGNDLIRYDAAIKALAEAHRVDEVKTIHDKAKALEIYAKQAKDKRLLNMAAEIRVRAERRAGELLIVMKKRGERHSGHGDQKSGSNESTPKLSDMGISKDQSSDWQKLAEVEPENFNAFLKESLDNGDLITATRIVTAVKQKMEEGKLPPEERKEAMIQAKIGSEKTKRAQAIKQALRTFSTFDIAPEKAANSNLFQHTEYVVNQYLDGAVKWLNKFAAEWKKQ